MQKYQQYYEEMIDQNQKLFDSFFPIHDAYAKDQDKNRDEFNKIGQKIIEIIRLWESKLCGKSEGGGYAKYSHNLAEKFWNLIRKDFPYIDFVGCK